MLDIEDPKTNEVESQQFASENNATTANNHSVIDSQTNSHTKELDDDDGIYENMIFPS